MKKIITVTGEIPLSACRMVLSHEHLFIDLTNQKAAGALVRPLLKSDHDKLMCDPYCMQDNLLINNFRLAVNECRMLLESNCNTVVDCSTTEIGRDPEKLHRLALETGMNIVMGCGYYTQDTHPAYFARMSETEAAEKLISEVVNGINGIRPGVIGEIGTSAELLKDEKKALLAAAKAHQASGLAVQVHIYPWSTNGLPAAQILLDNGVRADKIVICHSDVEPQWDYIRTLLKLGVWVELDNFGKEFTPADGGFASGKFIKDAERAKLAAEIIDAGYGKQLLLTNDICLKCMLTDFGGKGYRHIFDTVVPLISGYGISENYLKTEILRENPLNMLAI
ncbi:MAG: hypothetical protein J6S43_04715 [Lentisphaeria bacterium]|nr:hypothetical protein [Lentisphaeria bacterium]